MNTNLCRWHGPERSACSGLNPFAERCKNFVKTCFYWGDFFAQLFLLEVKDGGVAGR